MARYIGPTCKLARREGADLSLKSPARAIDSKCKLEQKPGQHGAGGARRRACPTTPCSCARSRRSSASTACSSASSATTTSRPSQIKGNTGENLLRMLESRLDNIVYRMGFAVTRAQARQLVSHKAIEVNGKKVNLPSYAGQAGRSGRGRREVAQPVAHQGSADPVAGNGSGAGLDRSRREASSRAR